MLRGFAPRAAGALAHRLEALVDKLEPLIEGADLALELLRGLIEPAEALGEHLRDLGSFQLDDHARADSEEDLRLGQGGAPNKRIGPERDQDLAPARDPVESLEGLAGAQVFRPGGGQKLMLLDELVELGPVRLEAVQLLLHLAVLGRGRSAHGRSSVTDSIRINRRATPWHPPISESAHSRARAAESASHVFENVCQVARRAWNEP